MLSTCSRCKRKPAFYARTYSGEKLCNKCFCRSIENKVKATIRKYDMLHFDDKIALGVSGGKDSMTLLRVLALLEKPFPKTRLTAVTVDEGIRSYGGEALKIAEEGCQTLGVEHVIVSFEELFGYELDKLVERLNENKKRARGGLTPCAYCGVLRRRALNLAARNCGATKLATAHNLDDEIQTVLMNIFHGDTHRIVRAKPVSSLVRSHFVTRIKPFCQVLEKEIALYAYLKKIKFQNRPCPYSAEALRNDIRSLLNRMEQKHPGLKYTVYRSSEKLWFPEKTSKMKDDTLRNCKICDEPTLADICQPCKMLQSLTSTPMPTRS